VAGILIAFYSRSGNTAAMAEHVAEAARGVAGADVTVKPVGEVDPSALADYHGIILGSPTYYGLMASEMKALFDASVVLHGSLEGKVGGAFTSAANRGGGNETCLLSILQAMLIHGMVIRGTAQRDHYGPVALGPPDDRAVAECRKLGRAVAELAVALHG